MLVGVDLSWLVCETIWAMGGGAGGRWVWVWMQVGVLGCVGGWMRARVWVGRRRRWVVLDRERVGDAESSGPGMALASEQFSYADVGPGGGGRVCVVWSGQCSSTLWGCSRNQSQVKKFGRACVRFIRKSE